VSAALSSVKDKRKEFEQRQDQIDEQLKKIDQKYTSLNNEVRLLELSIQRNELDINLLKDELVALGSVHYQKIDDEEEKRAENLLSKAKSELEDIGSINQLAVSQYEDQKNNYKQLSIRQNELENEKRSIVEFMEEIEKKKREIFIQDLEIVNEKFIEFFSKLTGGGKGYLLLQNSDDPFAGGLDIFIQFPRKNLRLISGASGGEKSVTAVAFIFAIQSLFPAPFYIFDEIDAHLDPANTERLADLLKEQSVNSQLIVLTLRDVVMDRAERLFGVYSQGGISRIVSAKISEVPA
jgi:chromosome segregation protein